METLYDTVNAIIAAQKKARQNNDFLGLLLNAEALLEYIPGLINHSIEQEKGYRKFEAGLSNEKDDNGKRNSSTYCETQAKATDFYSEWQKAKLTIELLYEMVAMGKKIAGGIDTDLKATRR